MDITIIYIDTRLTYSSKPMYGLIISKKIQPLLRTREMLLEYPRRVYGCWIIMGTSFECDHQQLFQRAYSCQLFGVSNCQPRIAASPRQLILSFQLFGIATYSIFEQLQAINSLIFFQTPPPDFLILNPPLIRQKSKEVAWQFNLQNKSQVTTFIINNICNRYFRRKMEKMT